MRAVTWQGTKDMQVVEVPDPTIEAPLQARTQQDEDVLGVESFATHHVPQDQAPQAYETFQQKEDGADKIVFRP